MRLSIYRYWFAIVFFMCCAFVTYAGESGAPPLSEDGIMVPTATTNFPNIEFNNQPVNDNKAIALTFDDGPDSGGVVTDRIIQILRQQGVPATFFINTLNFTDVNNDPAAQQTIRNVISNGFTLGNHTVHHDHLPNLSDAQVESELAGVEATVQNIFGTSAPRLTLFRAPFGEPYHEGSSQADLDRIAPIVAKHAVSIGWSIDPQDYNCTTASCVQNNVLAQVDAGRWGIILLHSVYNSTADALPGLITALRNRGFHFVTVEDVVRAKYGISSGEIIGGSNTTTLVNQGESFSVISNATYGGTGFSLAPGQTLTVSHTQMSGQIWTEFIEGSVVVGSAYPSSNTNYTTTFTNNTTSTRFIKIKSLARVAPSSDNIVVTRNSSGGGNSNTKVSQPESFSTVSTITYGGSGFSLAPGRTLTVSHSQMVGQIWNEFIEGSIVVGFSYPPANTNYTSTFTNNTSVTRLIKVKSLGRIAPSSDFIVVTLQ